MAQQLLPGRVGTVSSWFPLSLCFGLFSFSVAAGPSRPWLLLLVFIDLNKSASTLQHTAGAALEPVFFLVSDRFLRRTGSNW